MALEQVLLLLVFLLFPLLNLLLRALERWRTTEAPKPAERPRAGRRTPTPAPPARTARPPVAKPPGAVPPGPRGAPAAGRRGAVLAGRAEAVLAGRPEAVLAEPGAPTVPEPRRPAVAVWRGAARPRTRVSSAHPLRRRLRDPRELRRAVVLTSVLGPPRGIEPFPHAGRDPARPASS